MVKAGPAVRIDAFLAGDLVLRQSADGHRAGTDAVLLAAAIGNPEGHVIDAGAGVGAVGLMLARRAPHINVTLVEIDAQAANLARENIALNDFSARVRVVEADVLQARTRRAAGLLDACADIVLANPPWLTPGQSRASSDPRRALAHVMTAGGLAGWIRALAALTKPRGRMAIITPAAALGDILKACESRFGDLALLPVHPRAGEAAIRLIVVGSKASKGGARLLPGFVLHGDDGAFTPLAEALHRGAANLDLK